MFLQKGICNKGVVSYNKRSPLPVAISNGISLFKNRTERLPNRSLQFDNKENSKIRDWHRSRPNEADRVKLAQTAFNRNFDFYSFSKIHETQTILNHSKVTNRARDC